jgi:hypothetical protein
MYDEVSFWDDSDDSDDVHDARVLEPVKLCRHTNYHISVSASPLFVL